MPVEYLPRVRPVNRTCTTREPETGLRCLRLRDHDGRHKFGLETPGWLERLVDSPSPEKKELEGT